MCMWALRRLKVQPDWGLQTSGRACHMRRGHGQNCWGKLQLQPCIGRNRVLPKFRKNHPPDPLTRSTAAMRLTRVVAAMALIGRNGVAGWGKESIDGASALMESLRSEPSPNLTQFEDRASCSCCCCGDVVPNRSFINTGPTHLELLLQHHGVIGCDGMKGLVDPNSTKLITTRSGAWGSPNFRRHYKQNVQEVTHATLRDGRAVAIFITDDAWYLGVGP